MGIGLRIKEIRENSNMSSKVLANKLGVTTATITNVETEKNYPKFSSFIKLLDIFDSDANFYFQDYKDFSSYQFSLTDEEKELVKRYRCINAAGRNIIRSITKAFYYAYLEFEKRNGLLTLDLKVPIKSGEGILFTQSNRCVRILNNSLNAQADYVFQVITNQLKPLYKPGDYLLIKKREVTNGEIGLFKVGDSIYSRRLLFHNGKTLLLSISGDKNFEFENNSQFECIGVILGKVVGEIHFE